MWPRRRDDEDADPVSAGNVVVRQLGLADLNDCWRLDHRCFSDGEAYDRETIRYLLAHENSTSYAALSAAGQMLAFVIGMIEADGMGHVVALGVSPESRRQGLGRKLMFAVERGFVERHVSTVRLEVRTSNFPAQRLYLDLGYRIIRRMPRYYTTGDDGYLMIKDLL